MPKLTPKAWGVEGEAQHNNRTRSLQHLLGTNHRAALSKRRLVFPAQKLTRALQNIQRTTTGGLFQRSDQKQPNLFKLCRQTPQMHEVCE